MGSAGRTKSGLRAPAKGRRTTHEEEKNAHTDRQLQPQGHKRGGVPQASRAHSPGLVSKTWLANAETNTYGGVYVWSDRGAMEAYKETEIYKGLQANPHFENVTATDFAIVEGATHVTRGHVEVAA